MDINELDELTIKKFNKLVKKQPESLNNLEVAFLKARRDYMNKDQAEKFEKLLEPKKETKAKTK